MNSKPVKSDSLSRGCQNTASLQACAFSLLLNARAQRPGALRAICTAAKEKRLTSSRPSRDKVPPAPRLLAHSSWEVVSSPDFSLSGWECQPENPRRGRQEEGCPGGQEMSCQGALRASQAPTLPGVPGPRPTLQSLPFLPSGPCFFSSGIFSFSLGVSH